MTAILAPDEWPTDCDERTVYTGSVAQYLHGARLEQAIWHLAAHPYEQGSVWFARDGVPLTLAVGSSVVLPCRLSIFSRDLAVEVLADGLEDRELELTATCAGVSGVVAFAGVDAADQRGIDWRPVPTLRGVGDGTAQAHNRTADSGQTIALQNTGAGSGVYLYAVAWRELHTGLLEE